MTASSQHAGVKKFLGELKAALLSSGGRNNHGGGCGHNNLPATEKETLERRISQLKAAVKHKWAPGGF